MRIRPVKKRNRNETLFIWEFCDQDEVDAAVVCFDHVIDALSELPAERTTLLDLKAKFLARCDDKYANDEVYKSALFFSSEQALLTEILFCLYYY